MIQEIPINLGAFKSQNQRSVRNSGYAEDLINIFIDIVGSNYDRPTLDLYAQLPNLEAIGMYYFDGVLVVVTAERKIFTIDSDQVVVDITGVDLPGFGRPVFTDNKETLIIVGGGTPIKWEGVGEVTEDLGGSPPQATHASFLDGFLILNRRLDSESNKVEQFSEFEDIETWIGTSIFSAVADPDEVQGHTVCQRELYVVGSKTCEVWQNVGAFPVPFARSFIWQFGTSAKYSIISVENSVIFIDQDRRILQFSGREVTRLSDAIEEELSTYETVTDCISSSFTWNGSVHVLFVFPTARKTWSVDLRNKQWTEWRGFDNGWTRPRINCSVYSNELRKTFAGDYITGKIWVFSDEIKTDAEGIFKRNRKFSQRDGGASIRKQANLIRINMRRDVATSYEGSLPETNPTLEVRWKDDGKSWSNYRQVSLGERGEARYYAEIYRLGIYRNRQYEIQFSDPVAFNITSIETDEEALTT